MFSLSKNLTARVIFFSPWYVTISFLNSFDGRGFAEMAPKRFSIVGAGNFPEICSQSYGSMDLNHPRADSLNHILLTPNYSMRIKIPELILEAYNC